jgi:hypothetical protein
VRSFNARRLQKFNPERSQICIDEDDRGLRHSRAQFHFLFLRSPRSELKSLKHVFPLDIGVVAENIVNGVACGKLSKDSADRNAGAFDARFSTHNSRSANDAVEPVHSAS